MLRTIHTAAAILSYVLGGLTLLAIFLYRQNVLRPTWEFLFEVIDLPLIAALLLYGGCSLAIPMVHSGKVKHAWVVAGVCMVLFFLVIWANFFLPIRS